MKKTFLLVIIILCILPTVFGLGIQNITFTDIPITTAGIEVNTTNILLYTHFPNSDDTLRVYPLTGGNDLHTLTLGDGDGTYPGRAFISNESLYFHQRTNSPGFSYEEMKAYYAHNLSHAPQHDYVIGQNDKSVSAATMCGSQMYYAMSDDGGVYEKNTSEGSRGLVFNTSKNLQGLHSNTCETFWTLDDQGIISHYDFYGNNISGGFNTSDEGFPTLLDRTSLTGNTTDLYFIGELSYEAHRIYNLDDDLFTKNTSNITRSVGIQHQDLQLYSILHPGNANFVSVNFTVVAPDNTVLVDRQNGTFASVSGSSFTNWTSATFSTNQTGTYNWNYTATNSQGQTFFEQSTFQIIAAPVISITNPSSTVTTSLTTLNTEINDVDLDSCWYNITASDDTSSCLGSSCAVEFTCESSPNIPDLGVFSNGNSYTLFVSANDTQNNLGTNNKTFSVSISAAGGGGGGGGETVLFNSSAEKLTYNPRILTISVLGTPNQYQRAVRFTNEANPLSYEIKISEELQDYVTASVCDLDLTNCQTSGKLKSGQQGVLNMNVVVDEQLGTGRIGTISISSNTNSFDFPLRLERVPLYNQVVALQGFLEDFGVQITDFEGYLILILLIILIPLLLYFLLT